MGSRTLTDALAGRAPLRRVFWLYCVGGSLAYSVLGLWVDPLNLRSVTVYSVIGVGIGVVQCIMLWRCAYNGKSRAVGHLVRASVLAGLILIPLLGYLFYIYAGAMIF